MKINFLGKQALDLDDHPLPGGMMNIMVSEILATSRGGADPQKLLALSRKIRKGECDIDTPDLDLVAKTVRDHENYMPFAKGQILDELDEQRLAGKAKK
jgi:hypothetical protein